MRSLFLAAFLSVSVTGPAFANSLTQAAGCTLPCNSSIPSLGYYVVKVNPAYAAAFADMRGYDPTSGLFISSLMYDPNTVIGLSPTYTDGSAPASLTVGATGAVNGTSVTAVTETPGNTPTSPAGFPTGNDAISTAILSLNLESNFGGGGASVVAGSSYPSTGGAAGSPNLGEVESQSCNPAGAPCNDFPAQSFFDIFADITIPGMGAYSNTSPFVLQSTLPAPGSLPPTVLYTFTAQSSTVPLYADADEGPSNVILKGDQIGTVALLGHGVQFQDTNQGAALFGADLEAEIAADNQLNTEEQNFLDAQINADDIVTPEPSSFLLLLSGAAGLLGWRRLRQTR